MKIKIILVLLFFWVVVDRSIYAQSKYQLKHARYWLSKSDFQHIQGISDQMRYHHLNIDSLDHFLQLKYDSLQIAQDSIEALLDKKVRVTLSSLMTSSVNYMGRQAGVNNRGATPALEIKLPFGLTFYGALNYWSAEKNPWALTELGLGYVHSFLENFSAGIDYEKWLFHTGSKAERNLLTNYSAVNVDFDNDVVTSNLSFSHSWGTTKANALIYTLGWIKSYRFVGNMRALNIVPTGTFIAGNQNYLLRNFKSVKQSNGTLAKRKVFTQHETKFEVLDYELAIPVEFIWRKASITATSSYAFPMNPTLLESNHPFFYFTLELKVFIR